MHWFRQYEPRVQASGYQLLCIAIHSFSIEEYRFIRLFHNVSCTLQETSFWSRQTLSRRDQQFWEKRRLSFGEPPADEDVPVETSDSTVVVALETHCF